MFTKNIFTNKDGIADLVGNILEADYKNKMEELKGNQHKIDKNKNNKIDAHDFKILRGEKSAQKEEVDPTDTTTDTLRGREKTSKNPMLSKKVMMDVPDNVKEEVVEEDKNKESPKEFKARMNRLSQPNDTTGSTWLKDPRRQAFLDKIPGYKDAMALAHKTTNKGVKEEAEQIDELKKSTLGSYISKASRDAASTWRRAKNAETPTSDKFKAKTRSRLAGIDKAVGRLAKEEAEQVDEEQLNELSPDTLNRYMKAAKKDINKNKPSMDAAPGSKRLFNINKRVSGYRKAWAKRDDKESSQANTNSMNVRKEETEPEQIDELKKSTLTSYATKARAHGEKLSREGEAAMKRTSPKSLNTAYQKFRKATLRHLGASTAERKASMKREDVEQVDEEQLDELSTKTLSSYVKSRGAQLVGGYGDAKKVKGINKALRKIKQKNEDIEQVDEEQLDELKKSTLVRYATKANKSSIDLGVKASRARDNDDMETWAKNRNKAEKRDKGIQKAMGKIRKEETEQIDERTLTKGETAEKERIVKGMKKSLSGFKARYGDKAKSVMYATATARAKKD